MVAHPPGHGALLAGLAGLVGLALDAQIHDVVPTDGAVVHLDIITIIIIIIIIIVIIIIIITWMSQAQSAAAFHFLTSNLFFSNTSFFFGQIFNPDDPGEAISESL